MMPEFKMLGIISITILLSHTHPAGKSCSILSILYKIKECSCHDQYTSKREIGTETQSRF